MTEQQAVDQAMNYFDSGAFQQLLARRIACVTESQHPQRQAGLQHYL